MPLIAASFSAALSCSAIWYRLEAWIRREACSEMARVSLGCAWPRVFTAIPARASRYFLPDASQTQTPLPWVNATGIREYVFIREDMGSTVQIFSGAERTLRTKNVSERARRFLGRARCALSQRSASSVVGARGRRIGAGTAPGHRESHRVACAIIEFRWRANSLA